MTVASPELGLGAAAVVAAGGRGTVAATFAKAAYLRLPAGLVAVTTTEVPSGPLHARGRHPIHRLSAGDQVAVDGSTVHAGPVALDLTGATVWKGTLPGRAELAAGCDLALDLLGAVPTALADPSYEGRVGRAVAHLDAHDLAGAVDALAGLGPGLTPAGDDALAGILLVSQQPVDVRQARTNDIARAFLAWAGRGQSIEPVHRLLVAVAGTDRRQAEAALGDLLRFGHSSGADLAYGLRLGFESFIAKAR